MSPHPGEPTTNEAWLAALRSEGPEAEVALEALRRRLLRGLRGALRDPYQVSDADLEDFVQEALLKVLAHLEGFRGESRFTTWATKIAIRVALTELRRRRWRDVSLERPEEALEPPFDPAGEEIGPEAQALRRDLTERLHRAIETVLTPRQRQALVAVMLQGIPLEEVARRMGTNRNALYKLLHDARRKLRRALEAQGLTAEALEVFDER